MGKHTRVQMEHPHIIETLLADLTTENEEHVTDHGRSMGETTAWPGTIDHSAGPMS
jgi:hypothetical protein